MIKQCFLAKTGIIFYSETLAELGINPDALWPEVIATPIATPTPSTFVDRDHDIPTVDSGSAPSTAKSPTPLITTMSAFSSASTSTTLTTPEIEHGDLTSPIYDQLKLSPFWWVLELIPMRHRYQDKQKVWRKFISYAPLLYFTIEEHAHAI